MSTGSGGKDLWISAGDISDLTGGGEVVIMALSSAEARLELAHKV